MNIREIYEFLSQYGLGIPERVAFNDEDPVEPANIDLRQRPTMTNPDGTVSTVGTIGAGIDGHEVLLPTVGFDSGGLGRVLSEGDAIRRYLDTGDHLGKFRTQQGAEWEADRIHNAEQARVGWMPKGGEGAGTDFDMTQDPHGGVPAMQFTQEDLMNTLNALGPMLLENATGPGQAVQSTQRLSQVDPWLAAHNLIMGRTSPVNALTGVAEGATDVLGMVPGVGPIEAGLAKGAGAMFGALGPMWTSKLKNVLSEKGPGRAVTEELSQTLGNWAKKGEFKPEELEWSGLPEWLGRKPGQKVTKQEVLDAFDEGSLKLNEVWKGGKYQELTDSEYERFKQLMEKDDLGSITPQEAEEMFSLQNRYDLAGKEIDATSGGTKFSQYQLPGGEDYREMLLTLPDKPFVLPEGYSLARMGNGEYSLVGPDEVGTRLGVGKKEEALQEAQRRLGLLPEKYTSSHWDEPNPLAHVRMNTRVDADGKKVLFLEEVQSDWHQKGRKHGYGTREDIDAGRVETGAPPDAPFKTTWPTLAFKRVLKHAAENDFDRIAWTTGSQQADRYDLSKQIDSIAYRPDGDGTFEISAIKDGEGVLVEHGKTPKQLEDLVGKEIAQKIVDGEGKIAEGFRGKSGGVRELSGLDLKVGGEGMKGFYDRILPNEVNKYVKKWGGKVGTTKIDTIPGGAREYGDFLDRQENPDFRMLPVHSVDITPSMKRDVLEKGQELFNLAPLGALTGIREDDQGRITYDPARGLAGLAGGVAGAVGLSKMAGKGKIPKPSGKVPPKVIETATGPRLQKDVDSDLVKMLREGLEQRTKPSEVKSETRTFNSKESVPKWNWEHSSVQKTGGSFNPLLPEEGETLAARPKRSSDVPSSVSSGEIVTKKDLDDVLTYHTKEEKLLKSPTMWVHQEDPQSPAYLIVNVNVGNKTSKPYGYEINGSPERVRAVLDQIQDKMQGRTGNKAFRLSWPEYNPDTQPFRDMGRQQLPEPDLSNLLREGLEKRKSNLPPADIDGKAARIDTPEFSFWFGKSKVVDENKKPLVVYHGTADVFSKFQKGKGNPKDSGWMGNGFYFSNKPELANAYTLLKSGDSRNVMPVYLSMENPYIATIKDKERLMLAERRGDKFASEKWTEHLKSKGHDGVIIDFGMTDGTKEYVVFEPTQIKSIWNQGKWSKSDPDIIKGLGAMGAGLGLAYQAKKKKEE